MAIAAETANLGLLDLEASIDWTIDHIEAFGGDPENITVMGQSAGAMNIACMLMRQPRFQRGILQSPSLGRGFRSLEKAHEIADIFLRAAGAENVEEARQLPVSALLEAQRAEPVRQWLANENAQRSLFCPVADGLVLPKEPNQALKAAARHIDVIVGYTQDEMASFPGGGLNPASKALGDEIYGAASRQWATDAIDQGRNAWSYQFNHRPNDKFGACHCIELPFVFDTLQAFAEAPMLKGIQPQQAQRLVDELQSSWGAFIRGGDPGWAPWPNQKIFS
jgi:para-nitrobenzyl esterase